MNTLDDLEDEFPDPGSQIDQVEDLLSFLEFIKQEVFYLYGNDPIYKKIHEFLERESHL